VRRPVALKLVLVIAIAGLGGAACSKPRPELGVYLDGGYVSLEPTGWGGVEDAGNIATLRSRPGKTLQVAIPGDLTGVPIAALGTYRTADGREGSTPPVIIRDRHAVTINLPDPKDQLRSMSFCRYVPVSDDLVYCLVRWDLAVDPA
jgi:hypothetical protein